MYKPENTFGVYKITSKCKPERIYIGSSINVYKRFREHLNDLRKNKHHSIKLQRHYNKYGAEDLRFEILEICLPYYVLNIEQKYIDNLKPYFNISKTASGTGGCGHPMSEENKQKLRLVHLGKKKDPEAVRKSAEARRGLKPSKETRKKMSEAHSGKKHSKEWCENISKGQVGRVQSKESREKMSKSQKGRKAWNKGIPRDEVTKEKIRQKLKGVRCSEETAQKISKANKGHKAWNKGLKYSRLINHEK